MKINKISFDSYTSLDDDKALEIIRKQNFTTKLDNIEEAKALDLSTDAPWLKLHMEQQTAMLNQWTTERRKLTEENKKLKAKIKKYEALISKLKEDSGKKKMPLLTSKKLKKEERKKFEKKGDKKSSCPVPMDISVKPSQTRESPEEQKKITKMGPEKKKEVIPNLKERSVMPGQNRESPLTVCSSASTVVVNNIDYSRLSLSPVPYLNPKTTKTTIKLNKKTQAYNEEKNTRNASLRSIALKKNIDSTDQSLLRGSFRKGIEANNNNPERSNNENSVAPSTPQKVGIHLNSAFIPYNEISTPSTESENSDVSPTPTKRNAPDIIRKSSLDKINLPVFEI